jgi:hypothetical protein
MRSHRTLQHVFAFVISIIGAASGCATMETAIMAQPGVEFSLPLGQTAALNGNGVRITFRQVREDSRCPVDVQCVWAGDAKIELTVSRSGSDDVKILSLTDPNNETTSGDLRIRFVSLAPVPRQADADRPRAYVAQLVLSRG